MKIYHSKNFHKHTFCLWTEVSQTDFDLQKPQFISKSGSEYYFTEKGVYRISNHWGRAANCRWRLITDSEYKNQKEITLTLTFKKAGTLSINCPVLPPAELKVNP